MKKTASAKTDGEYAVINSFIVMIAQGLLIMWTLGLPGIGKNGPGGQEPGGNKKEKKEEERENWWLFELQIDVFILPKC